MRAMIVCDSTFASREQTLLSRLHVGLADEGVRVIQALPERGGEGGAAMDEVVAASTVRYSDSRIPFTLGLRAQGLITAVEGLVAVGQEPAEEPVDLVHVCGGSAWKIGLEVGRRLEVPVILEVWRSGLIARALGLAARLNPPPMLLAPDTTIEEALRKGGAANVRRATWGVHAGGALKPVLKTSAVPSVMMVGSGYNRESWQAAVLGLGRIVKKFGDLLVFIDADAAARAGVWPTANRIGIARNISLIQDLEGRRDLLVFGDVLLQPEALGEQRSIVLDAMASGMLVVAAWDPMVSALQDGVTGWLVAKPEPERWAEALLAIFEDPGAARRLAVTAHEFVREKRRASDFVRGVLEAYTWLTSRPAIPFPAPAA